MEIKLIEQDFNKVETEVLIIGVPEHPGNTHGWDDFVASFSTSVPEWLKSGDIKTDYKQIVKMPAMNDSGFKRVLFIGLGAKNKLTEERLRSVFAAVGKELSTMKAHFGSNLADSIYKRKNNERRCCLYCRRRTWAWHV